MIRPSASWKVRLAAHHPDRGGDPELFKRLVAERDRERAESIVCLNCGKREPIGTHACNWRTRIKVAKFCSNQCATRYRQRRLKGVES